MKHYGDRPPWEGESRYGHWRWVAPSPQDWFEEPGHWQWYPPHPSWGSPTWQLSRVLREHYLPAIRETLYWGSRFSVTEDEARRALELPEHPA